MNMKLMCACRLEQQPDDFAHSVFPKTAERLRQREGLLKLLDQRARIEGYVTALDFLLCMVFPQYVGPCTAYYRGEGKKLSTLYQKMPDILRELDDALLAALRGCVATR